MKEMKTVVDVKLRIFIDGDKSVKETEEQIKDFIAKGKYTVKEVGFKMIPKTEYDRQ